MSLCLSLRGLLLRKSILIPLFSDFLNWNEYKMGMGDSYSDDEPVSAINVTPLVDVMLVLMVIFMVTAPMMQQGVEVDLPKAAVGTLKNQEDPLILSVRKDGKVFVGEEAAVSLADLPQKVLEVQAARHQEGSQIFVRADKGLSYGEVMKVIGSLHASKITQVGLVTEE
jgi:biopolymer transport protein TolR